MLETISAYIGQHWFLSTYLSVMVLNEGAILGAFALAADQGVGRIAFVALASIAGSFTNDLVLYGLARYGFGRIFRWTPSPDSGRETAVFDRLFLGNPLLSLLFIKFLFGVRILLTIYLVAKKQIPFRPFVLYDAAGIALYVFVLGMIGVLIGQGNAGVEDYYVMIARTITLVTLSVLAFRLVGTLIERLSSPASGNGGV